MDTIAAIATAPGMGALGIVRLSGDDALSIALSFICPKSAPKNTLEPRQATLAKAGNPQDPIDEVIATYFPGPKSATGEDVVEISCHGSPYILRRLLEQALSLGARLAQPGEFTQRSFLNGCLDLSQAEAICGLIRARTQSSHRAALTQLQGGLSRAITELREPLLDLLVRIEATLDHPEEDIPRLSPEEVTSTLNAYQPQISNLLRTFRQGRLVAEGARVCIVGRPNAGKSSLMNALLGRERAIVCPTPGTTRDTLEEAANIEGIPSVLIDTAGLRAECSDPAEISGMERTRKALSSCDLALLVIDSSRPATPEDDRVHRQILESAAQAGRPIVSVLNKSDLPSAINGTRADANVSALKSQGIDHVMRLISDRLSPASAEPHRVIITSVRHQQALMAAVAELEEINAVLSAFPGQWEDRASCHLRESLRFLGEIIGEGTPDEVLSQIFARFCVGK